MAVAPVALVTLVVELVAEALLVHVAAVALVAWRNNRGSSDQ